MPFPLPTCMYEFHGARPNAVSLDAVFGNYADKRIIISMYEEEDDYFAGLQLIHGVARDVVSFQHLHDLVYEAISSKGQMLLGDVVNNLFCSDPYLVEKLLDNNGDLKHERIVRRMRHTDSYPRTLSRFII